MWHRTVSFLLAAGHVSPVLFDVIDVVSDRRWKSFNSQNVVNTVRAVASLRAVISFSAAILLSEGPGLCDNTVWT
eukprot:1809209-Karenia_brevis.AAC.1